MGMWLKEDNTDLKNIIGDNKLCMIGDFTQIVNLWLYCILAYVLMMSTSLFVCLSTF